MLCDPDELGHMFESGPTVRPYIDDVLKKDSKAYGQFSKFQICFCGLDPGNLKFETVRTNKQHICF